MPGDLLGVLVITALDEALVEAGARRHRRPHAHLALTAIGLEYDIDRDGEKVAQASALSRMRATNHK